MSSFRDRLSQKEQGIRKTFQHSLVQKLNLVRDDTGPRQYITTEGNSYPSVTTVLGAVEDKSFLVEWKARVGEDEANKITNQSARRGTALHSICERYLLNEEDYLQEISPIYVSFFKQIKPFLDEHLTVLFGCELPLYSDELKIAGTTDNFSVYRQKNSIVDFKNSRRFKDYEDIEGYFVQTAIYALMIKERYQIDIEQLVILMAVEGSLKGSEFIKPLSEYEDKARSVIKEYYDSIQSVA